jgi:hypothetical protein
MGRGRNGLPQSQRHFAWTPEQQEGYRFLVETRGAAGGPSRIWVHNPKLVKASAPLGAHFHPRRLLALRARGRDRRHHHQQQMAFGLPDQRA